MSDYQSQKRQFLVILTIVFLGFIGISMPYLIFPSLFLNPSYSILPDNWGEASRALFLGITLAAYPIGQFIGSPILGALSDEYGRKKLLTGSLIITGVCNLFTGYAIAKQYLALLIISRLITGVMEGNIAIARAMAADFKLLPKHKTFGRINAVTSIAYLIGPLFGASLADTCIWEGLTASTPFFFICILFLFLAALSSIVLKKSVPSPSMQKRTFLQRINFIKSMSVLFTNRELKSLMIVSTLFTLAIDIFYEFGPVYLTVKWNLVPSQLISYNAVLCLALAIGNGWLPTFFSTRSTNRILITSGICAFALCVAGSISVNSPYLMLFLFAVCGLAIGLSMTLITVMISDSVLDSKQGEVMGTQLSLRVLGDGLICLFGGALLILSSKLILIISSIMALVALAYYRFLGKGPRHADLS